MPDAHAVDPRLSVASARRPAPIAADEAAAEARALLERWLRVLPIEAGVTFIEEGGPTPFLGFVRSGRVALRMRVPERGAVTILTVDPGELLGWSAIVPPHRATTSATALEATVLDVVDANVLRDVLAGDRDLASRILPAVLAVVSARLTATRTQLLDLFRDHDEAMW